MWLDKLNFRIKGQIDCNEIIFILFNALYIFIPSNFIINHKNNLIVIVFKLLILTSLCLHISYFWSTYLTGLLSFQITLEFILKD